MVASSIGESSRLFLGVCIHGEEVACDLGRRRDREYAQVTRRSDWMQRCCTLLYR